MAIPTRGRIVRQHAIGSGVIVDPDGYIVTNAHVVEGAQRVRVVVTVPNSSSRSEPRRIRSQQVFTAMILGRHLAQAAVPNSPNTGVQTGDIIRAINRTRLQSVFQLQTMAREFKSGDAVVLQIERGSKLQYLAFEKD